MPEHDSGSEAVPRLGTWTQAQADDYELAHGVLSALVSAYAQRIATASDAGERAEQVAVQARYARERRLLSVGDDAEVARVLRDYTPLVRQLDTSTGQ